MAATSALPTWPPKVSDAELATLLAESSTYALGHGFTLLPPGAPPPAPTHAIAAPLSLFPTPFPKAEYIRAKGLQRVYNALYARIALDWEFLDGVMGSVAEVDEFQGELWRGWKKIRQELVQPQQLGIFRSDYLLDTSGGDAHIKQVEFNTIAASFGALSQKAGEMHRYLAASTGYYNASSHLSDPSAFPDNHSLEEIARGLAEGHAAFGGSKHAVVLFVVQDGERNVFDQRGLEYELLKTHGVRAVRRTFAQLESEAELDASTRQLTIPTLSGERVEVSLIYYRAAYTPTDYKTAAEWETRALLERSTAIKCPSMALQLAGAKKVQQVLAAPGVLEDFLLGPSRPDVGLGAGAGSLTDKDIAALRETWTGLYPLDASSDGQAALKLALEESSRFVLKPQREGGGNNIYRADIPPFLSKLDAAAKSGEPHPREGYILMELIEPPQGVHNWLVRGGEGKARDADVVSELGVYGVSLFGGEGKGVNREAGTLLRTKGRESDEGGVAIGISSIDSPLLI